MMKTIADTIAERGIEDGSAHEIIEAEESNVRGLRRYLLLRLHQFKTRIITILDDQATEKEEDRVALLEGTTGVGVIQFRNMEVTAITIQEIDTIHDRIIITSITTIEIR